MRFWSKLSLAAGRIPGTTARKLEPHALQVISPTALPSGTVLQAQVTETFTLSSGEVASEEQRRQDIVLFAHPAAAGTTLAAEVPITPSRTFTSTELASGKVHLDILAGREGVRGKTGGLEAVQIDSGDVRLGLAKQSLADDTAVAVEQTVLSPFLPSRRQFPAQTRGSFAAPSLASSLASLHPHVETAA